MSKDTTNETANKMVETYYDDALRIANSFNSKFLLQDDKEGVALLALIRASRTYKNEVIRKKKKVSVKFSTHLYNVVWNSLRNSVKRAKEHGPIFHNRRLVKLDKKTRKRKLDMFELKFDDFDPYRLSRGVGMSDHEPRMSLFDLIKAPEQDDPLVLKELLFLVRKHLNVKQNKILDFCFNPHTLHDSVHEVLRQRYRKVLLDENEISNFIAEVHPNFTNFTYFNMGKALQCTRQRIHQHIIIIRDVFTNIYKEQNNENFKLTKEEQGELYGR